MTRNTTLKLIGVSMLAGLVLLFGVFVISTSVVSGQAPPEPEPSQTEPAEPREPTTGDESGRGRNGKECDREDEPEGDASTGIRFGGPRSFRQ